MLPPLRPEAYGTALAKELEEFKEQPQENDGPPESDDVPF